MKIVRIRSFSGPNAGKYGPENSEYGHLSRSVTLVLTYHPVLKSVYNLLRKTHSHTFKPPRLKYVLPSPPRVAFRNDKSLKYKLVQSKLRNPNKRTLESNKYGSKLGQIYDIISLENEFTDRHKREAYEINVHFDCNGQFVIYLITCKVCRKQYVGSTITPFRKRFNQCKSNIKLYSVGRRITFFYKKPSRRY